ncbi:IPT/TIG domain-containing protein [Streptomyces sp. NBS 14/10]|uniref:IPT/TIG domain-containing protein n=1 Tax=Streptomyces sp. NBS 14/10 TaxID=1945643 RepID=UPI000B802EEA|nr:IPT/TIG domain-containing protein [Streptomyces sp. NBS 14/10]KAK1178904.1 IPT/TIG domain-containing protein [Streptomyces sp. NBS 14/10]
MTSTLDSAASLAASPSGLFLPHTIPVGPTPVGIAVTPNGATAYVADSGGTAVTAISTATDTVAATVTVGSGPWAVAVSPDGAYAYVTRTSAGAVAVIATATNTVAATISGFSSPRGLAVTPDGSRLYVANSGAGTVAVVNTATRAVIATVTVGSSPDAVVVRPDGAVVYVSNTGSGTVSAISTATNTVSATISGFSSPHGLAVTPDGSQLYVANTGGQAVGVVSTATNTVGSSVPIPVGGPAYLAISPDKTLVYAVTPAPGAVTVINLSAATITATLVGFQSPQRITTSRDGLRIYVTEGGTSSVRVDRRPASITPNQGSRGGGDLVTITGMGFTGTKSVFFGTSKATFFTVVDDSHITVVTPSATLSSVPVRVVSSGGSSAVGYFYYRRLPLLEQLSVTSGPVTGGTVVTLTGRRFYGVTGVWFNKTMRKPTVVSDTQMTVVVPPSSVSGKVPVYTANTGGVSNSLSFTYLANMTITSLSPTSGPAAGSRPININGTGLSAVTSVTIGGLAVIFKVMSDIKVQAISPAHAPGPAAVVVRTADNRTATSPVPYTYI